MEDFLSMDNILTGEEAASLFDTSVEDEKETTTTPPQEQPALEEDDNHEDTTEVDPESLFSDDDDSDETGEQPESVGSEEKNKETEKDTTSDKDGTSPEINFYSSIASALKEEGIFPDLNDDEIDSVKEAEDFRDLIDRQIQAGLDEALKRVYDALNSGVEPNVVKQYETTLNYLNNITDELINDETEKGETLRRQLLEQDFMNRGYSLERAKKMTEKLFASGEDIEEAKQALQGNKEFFEDKYNEILNEAKKKEEAERKAVKKLAEQLKKEILSGDKIFGNIEIDKSTRQKVYDNVAKPIYKNSETGEYYTALQKYRLEHENDFIKNVGILFTLTDGFTNLDKLVAPTAKKEVKKKLKELQHTLRNTTGSDTGNMTFVGTGNKSAGMSIFDLGFTIDIR